MKKTVRFLAFFFAVTLLFSSTFVPRASDNDKKYDSYVNMGENAIQNNYAIPNLFRQDKAYSNVARFPLVIKNGVEYVPLSMFILYPGVEVSYSKTGEDFFLLNKKNNHYISFNVTEGVAATHDGDLLKLSVQLFNSTKYVPARTVAVVLGFVCESYDDAKRGIYAFRVSDGKSAKTLAELVEPYILQRPELIKPPDNGEDDDPLKKLAPRRVALCYTGISSDNMTHLMNTLDAYRVKASFSVSADDVIKKPSLVRRIYVSGHKLLVTAESKGTTPEEYAKSYVDGLEKANKVLGFTLKLNTRMCTLPYDLPQEIRNNKEFIGAVQEAGYVIFTPNIQTDDAPDFSGNAYSVSSKIKNAITDGFAKDKEAKIGVLLWCSDKTPYYSEDVAKLVNKYAQFEFCPLIETFAYNNQGE